jgi:hypothetical protein
MLTDDEIRDYLAERKREAKKIDPQTADVMWDYSNISDPYGVYNYPLESVGRDYFARDPGSTIWVWFGDLPVGTRDKLMELYGRKLAFPAGLEELLRRHGPKE